MTKATTTKAKKAAKKPSRRHLPTKKHKAPLKMDGSVMSVDDSILAALKEYLEFGAMSPDRIVIALRCGYKNIRSETFAKALSKLKTSNLIEYPSKDTMRLTDLGMQKVGPVSRPQSNEAFHASIRGMLKKKKSFEIFDQLLDGSTVEKTELATKVGFSNPRSAGFGDAIKEMSTLKLLDTPKDETNKKKKIMYCLSDNAFPCGRPNGGHGPQDLSAYNYDNY